MRIMAKTATALTLALLVTGCGQKSASPESQAPPAGQPAAGAAATFTLPAGLDDGPRAAATPANPVMAARGEKLFQTRGCSACHGFGKRISCPDLNGVTTRRTAKWITTQILHPDVMTKQDPIARGLFAQFALQMPKQGLTAAQTDTVLEFLKHKNHESSEKHE